jgi:glutamate/tyrosine decarboxylase-like PLP-dependent enzyme
MASDTEWERLLHAAFGHALAYRCSLPARAVAAPASITTLLERLGAGSPVPDIGLAPHTVLDELVRLAEPGITATSGPRFFGWVTGGTLPAALAADWMTSAWDQNAGPGQGAPAATAFELTALRWCVELLGLPSQARGALVPGATGANFTCLAAARSHVLEAAGWDVEQRGLFEAPRVRVLAGQERHETIDKALRLLGFGKQALSLIGVDGQGRMSLDGLRRELMSGAGPVIVCAQAGNVNSGAFDPLHGVASAVSEYRRAHGEALAWLHIDGAFGLWARAAESHAELARGAELADSWTTDAHKFLNVPYDSGIALSRHPHAHRRSMAVHGAYLSSGASDSVTTPGAYAPELSRRARGFALWAALRQLGRQGLANLVTRVCTLARELGRALERAPGVTIHNEVVLNQVVAGFEPPSGASAKDFVRELCVAIQNEGTCYATPTIWRGTPAIRFSVINADTTSEDIVRSAHAALAVYGERRVSR